MSMMEFKESFPRKRRVIFAPRISKRRITPARRRRRRAVGELKFHDLDVDDAVVSSGGTIAEDSCLTIAEGNGESDRIGRKITVQAIMWRYSMQLPVQAAGANSSEDLRVILYQDKQTNGTAATITGILESADYQSFRNLSNQGRFLILHDRTYSLNSMSGGGDGTTNFTGEVTKNVTFFKKVNIPIEYDNSATLGVITSMRSNNIGVLTISRSGFPVFDSKMRIRYTDV